MRRLLSLLALLISVPLFAEDAKPVSLFDGKTLKGWEGDTEKTWKVEDGTITAGSLETVVPRNEFLCTTKTYENFELKVTFKLVGDKAKANAGVQFRTKRIPNHHEVSGYQADVGEGWWGKLYDESRRNKVLAGEDNKLGDKLKKEDWNDYVIRAEGKHIQLWVNGVQTVDYTEKEENIDSKGIIAVQIH